MDQRPSAWSSKCGGAEVALGTSPKSSTSELTLLSNSGPGALPLKGHQRKHILEHKTATRAAPRGGPRGPRQFGLEESPPATPATVSLRTAPANMVPLLLYRETPACGGALLCHGCLVHGLATESVVLPASRLSFMAFSVQGLQVRLLKGLFFAVRRKQAHPGSAHPAGGMNPQQAMSDVRHAIHTVFKGAVETVMPLRTESAFREKGVRLSTASWQLH